MIAHIPFSAYETPAFGIIVLVSLGWGCAVVVGFTKPRRYIESVVLQFACSVLIGVLAVFASVAAMGRFLEWNFNLDLDPFARHGVEAPDLGEGEPLFNLTELFAELSFAYHISKAGMWICCATFLTSVLLVLARRGNGKAELSQPRFREPPAK